MFESLLDRDGTAVEVEQESYMEIGHVLWRLSSLERDNPVIAADLLRRATEVFCQLEEREGRRIQTARTLEDLSRVYAIQDEWESALEAQRRALDIFESMNSSLRAGPRWRVWAILELVAWVAGRSTDRTAEMYREIASAIAESAPREAETFRLRALCLEAADAVHEAGEERQAWRQRIVEFEREAGRALVADALRALEESVLRSSSRRRST